MAAYIHSHETTIQNLPGTRFLIDEDIVFLFLSTYPPVQLMIFYPLALEVSIYKKGGFKRKRVT